MKLQLLYIDELRGFYKSKVMLFLWIGLPIIALLFRFIQSSSTGQAISFAVISALIVSSLAGTLGSRHACGLHNQREEQACLRVVPDKTIKKKRHNALKIPLRLHLCCNCKFHSYLCGDSCSYFTSGVLSATVFQDTAQSLAISLSMVAVSCSAGVLIGVAAPSVLVGAILVIYGGNQISVIPLFPTLLQPASSRPVHYWLSGGSLSCPPCGSHYFI